ncbi:MAG: hypothetical protein LW875_04335 [Proteobacteria bacterium]|jgi:hypothetical protein|nr:hypothetical protein [Pseudomonadota bacterium]
MRQIGLILGSLLLMVSYQNCGAPVPSGESNASLSGKILQEAVVQQIDLSDYSSLKILAQDFVLSDSHLMLDLDLSPSNGVDEVSYILKSFRLNPRTGGEELSGIYCVKGKHAQFITEFIASNKICRIVNQPVYEAGRLCAQVISSFPYAEAFDGQGSDQLGYKATPCDLSTDICDGKGELLKSFLAEELLNNNAYKNFSCN